MQAVTEIELSDPQARVLDATARRILFLAGVGSGKSHVISLLSADVIINNPELIQFIGANTYGQLTRSTLKRVFDVWAAVFGWVKDIHFVVDHIPPPTFKRIGEPLKSYENTISFANGALIFVASLDNYKVIDGTEFAIAYLDETKDTKEEAVKEVIITRLRQPGLYVATDGTVYKHKEVLEHLEAGAWQRSYKEDEPQITDEAGRVVRAWNPLYIFTSPAKVAWLSDWFNLSDRAEDITAKIFSATEFYQHEDENTAVVISSTYHNAHNLPPGFISGLKEQYAGNQNRINMIIYGSPIAKEGGEYVPAFQHLKHVKPTPVNKEIALHLTLDFNVIPYMTGLVCQLERVADRYKLKIVKEYALENPKNKTVFVCQAFDQDFGAFCKALYYYGDPSGRSRNTVSMEYTDNFDAVKKTLKRYLNNNSDRVPGVAPALYKSGAFLNSVFNGSLGIDVEIDPSCKKLIKDLEFSKEGLDGGVLKETTKDPHTKKVYQKNGHHVDALRYLLVIMFEKLYAKYAA